MSFGGFSEQLLALVAFAVLGTFWSAGVAYLGQYKPDWHGWSWPRISAVTWYVLRSVAAIAVIVWAVGTFVLPQESVELVDAVASTPLEQVGSSDPVLVPTSDSIGDLLPTWLQEMGYQTRPIALDDRVSLQTVIIHDGFSINLSVNNDQPELLIAGVMSPLPDDYKELWRELTQPTRARMVGQLMLDVGVDPTTGFDITDIMLAGTPTTALTLEHFIPIDASLTKPTLRLELEATTRYLKALRFAFSKRLQEQQAAQIP